MIGYLQNIGRNYNNLEVRFFSSSFSIFEATT